MSVDIQIEMFLKAKLVAPSVDDAIRVLSKYASVGGVPVFEAHGETCVEIVQPDVEKAAGGGGRRLRAAFDFRNVEDAQKFIQTLTWHWKLPAA